MSTPQGPTLDKERQMTKRGGLGRGLAALIPTSAPEPERPAPAAAPAPAAPAGPSAAPAVSLVPPPAAAPDAPAPATAMRGSDTEGAVGVPGAQLREVAVEDVVPNPKQPRQVFDDEAMDELTYSVREFGLLQPIVVRENGDGRYELIMGERRLRAARAAGLDSVPAIVRDTTDDAMLRDALLENIHRVQLNPLEEAAAYQQLLEEFGATHEELASRIGRSRSQVTNTIRLMKLPVKVPRRRTRWRPGSWPRGCRCGPPRRRSRWPPPSGPPPSGGHGTSRRRASRSWGPGSPIASRRRSRSRSGGRRGRSSWSSARSTTCSGSSASWRRRSPDAVPRPDPPPATPRAGLRHLT